MNKSNIPGYCRKCKTTIQECNPVGPFYDLDLNHRLIWLCQEWATYGPWAILVQPARPLEEKIIMWMNIMCTFAWVVGAARDRNLNSFSARRSKKVAHHWTMPLLGLLPPFILLDAQKISDNRCSLMNNLHVHCKNVLCWYVTPSVKIWKE